MSKPSIAELLRASGYSDFTSPLVVRAMYALYGNVGANLDERNWSSIMHSSNPLQAAEAALLTQYQDSGYLLRNVQHLLQSGYVAAQAEITYRQMAERLGYTYKSSWSDGTAYDYLGDLTYEQLVALVPVTPSGPLPTLSITASEAGFTVALNVAGTVSMSVSGSLGAFGSGNTVLTEQTAVKEGFLTLSANGNTSTATSQYVVLGTSGNDNIDFSAQASRLDYIFGGAGADTILGGAGDDVIHGGTDNDTITSGEGDDTLFGGDGDDKFRYLQSNDLQSGTSLADSINGGAGTNALVIGNNIGTQNSFQIFEAMSWSRMSNVSRIEAVGPFLAQYNLVFSNDAYETGLRVIDLSADTDGAVNTNVINVSAETGTANGFTLIGSVGADVITGGSGNDIITGGSGSDTISGGAGIDRLSGGGGRDKFQQNQGDSAYVDDPGSTIANRTANGYLANGDKLKFANGQIDVVTDFDSATDVVDASAMGANSTDGRMWKDFIRGQGHFAKGNWDGSELFTIDYATGRDILYFVSLNGANLAFNAFDIANGGIILVGGGSTGFTAANIV